MKIVDIYCIMYREAKFPEDNNFRKNFRPGDMSMTICEKPISYHQLMRMIRDEQTTGEQVDFLAVAMTSWHVMGILSVLLHLYAKRKITKGIIVIERYYELGWAVSEELFSLLSDKDIRIVRLTDMPKLSQSGFLHWAAGTPKKRTDHEFYCIVPQVPMPMIAKDLENIFRKRSIVHVIVDEGLGTYTRTVWGFVHLCTADLHDWGERFNVAAEWTQRYAAKAVLSCSHRLIDCNLFRKLPMHIAKNNPAISAYRRMYRAMGYGIDFSCYSHYGSAIIISGQPYTSSGVMYKNEDVAILKELCTYYREKQIPVIIKPHPREMHKGRYQPLLDMGCMLEPNQQYPMELILANLMEKPLGIIGMTSTPLITAKLFWNIPTYSIVGLLHPENMRKDLRKEMDCFRRKFQKYVKMIKEPAEVV